jgi:hypothetical protein
VRLLVLCFDRRFKRYIVLFWPFDRHVYGDISFYWLVVLKGLEKVWKFFAREFF